MISYHRTPRPPSPLPSPTPPSSRLDRAAALVVILGAAAAVLAVLPYRGFDLDRFFVPKELVLHLTAALSALLVLERLPRAAFGVVDLLLGGWLALGLASALLAENHWVAARALGISASGAALFWTTRTLARAGLGRRLLAGLSVAVVLGALTGLAQAYGLVTDAVSEYLSLARAPGGTFGNRNFMAHLCAIGTPALVHLALSTRRRTGALLAVLGLAAVAAAVVLSRSRAAWVALALAGGVLALGALWRWRVMGPSVVRRVAMLGGAVAAGVVGALLLPNALEWRSDSPYLESMAGVVNYRSGSGRGRLIQYETSFALATRHPVLGVGPGNWAVEYPRVARPSDPSFASDGTTANPWPSSDWAAHVSERGFPALLLLVAAFGGMLAIALLRLRGARRPEEATAALALAGTVLITSLVGAFDAVLLLAAPSLVAWSLLGTLGAATAPQARWAPALDPARRRVATVAVAAVGLLLVLRSASQVAGMAIRESGRGWRTLDRAALADPGSYRLRLQAAEAAIARGDCRRARRHAEAARDLLPAAPAPKRVLRRCR